MAGIDKRELIVRILTGKKMVNNKHLYLAYRIYVDHYFNQPPCEALSLKDAKVISESISEIQLLFLLKIKGLKMIILPYCFKVLHGGVKPENSHLCNHKVMNEK